MGIAWSTSWQCNTEQRQQSLSFQENSKTHHSAMVVEAFKPVLPSLETSYKKLRINTKGLRPMVNSGHLGSSQPFIAFQRFGPISGQLAQAHYSLQSGSVRLVCLFWRKALGDKQRKKLVSCWAPTSPLLQDLRMNTFVFTTLAQAI